MTRVRLRPAHTAEALAEIYREPHDHTKWRDHEIRVKATIELAQTLAGDAPGVVADLSCGSGAIAFEMGATELHLGDYAPRYPYVGPMELNLEVLPHVDLYICTETLEHVDEPDRVLDLIRIKADQLVLSTPVDAWQDANVEHYWAWSRGDVEAMLAAAGFTVELYKELDFRPDGLTYCYGIWGCR